MILVNSIPVGLAISLDNETSDRPVIDLCFTIVLLRSLVLLPVAFSEGVDPLRIEESVFDGGGGGEIARLPVNANALAAPADVVTALFWIEEGYKSFKSKIRKWTTIMRY